MISGRWKRRDSDHGIVYQAGVTSCMNALNLQLLAGGPLRTGIQVGSMEACPSLPTGSWRALS